MKWSNMQHLNKQWRKQLHFQQLKEKMLKILQQRNLKF
jgi:hypothetical protein